MLYQAFACKGFIGVQILFRGLLNDVWGKGWRWRFFVPSDTFEIVADELFIVGMLRLPRLIAFSWPKT